MFSQLVVTFVAVSHFTLGHHVMNPCVKTRYVCRLQKVVDSRYQAECAKENLLPLGFGPTDRIRLQLKVLGPGERHDEIRVCWVWVSGPSRANIAIS